MVVHNIYIISFKIICPIQYVQTLWTINIISRVIIYLKKIHFYLSSIWRLLLNLSL